jgi:protein-S-isoprenylcysteine O-methyltransferase Ste14
MINMYWKRVSAEEEMLNKQFGDEYRQFASTRYRLIPYVF